MSLTDVPRALESMQLQHKRHLEDIRHIRQRALVGGSMDMEGTVTSVSLAVPEEIPDHHTLVYNTMEECDSLLQFLNERHKVAGKIPPHQLYSSAIKVPKDELQMVEELRLHNEALRAHILDLLKECEEHRANRLHLENENKMLKYKLEKLQRRDSSTSQESSEQEEHVAPPSDINPDAIPDLPPLEMPQFDFDSFSLQDRSDPSKASSI